MRCDRTARVDDARVAGSGMSGIAERRIRKWRPSQPTRRSPSASVPSSKRAIAALAAVDSRCLPSHVSVHSTTHRCRPNRSYRRRAGRCAPLSCACEGPCGSGKVVALVSVELLGPLAWAAPPQAPDRLDGVYEFLEDL